MKTIHLAPGIDTGLHETIAKGIEKIARGQVWCVSCGDTKKVSGAACLRSGWPMCCGQTMTIDSPLERQARA